MTPKYVKTALRAPKARAKNFPKTCPPPEFLSVGARPPRWRDPYMKHCITASTTTSIGSAFLLGIVFSWGDSFLEFVKKWRQRSRMCVQMRGVLWEHRLLVLQDKGVFNKAGELECSRACGVSVMMLCVLMCECLCTTTPWVT